MSKNTLIYAFVAIGALVAGALGWQFTQDKTGKLDTDLVFAASFPDMNGQSQPLSQWKGQVVVLNFWATWCPPCIREMPMFVNLQQKYGSRGLVFVGIAVDQREPVEQFLRQLPVNYPILLGDAQGMALSRQLGNSTSALPHTIVIDRKGKAVAQSYGLATEAKLEAALLGVM